MIFSIAIIGIILAITFFQAIHGLFSAFIMMVLTILCAVLAVGFYEDLYYGVVRTYLLEYGEAVSLVLMFSVWLILLRVFFDQAIPGNVVLPVNVDRVGGAACGFVTALYTAGILALGFQLLPFETAILGFQRIDQGERKNLMLNPDGLVVKTTSFLSSNTLSGRQRFADRHPDFLLELHGARTIPRESPHRVPINALTVSNTWTIDRGLKVRGPKGLTAAPRISGTEWRVFRTQLTSGDEGGVHRFSRYSWRLVGHDEEKNVAEYYAFGLLRMGDSKEKRSFVKFGTQPNSDQEEFVTSSPAYTNFDILFELPTGFTPRFLEYKRTSHVEISEAFIKGGEAPPDAVKPAAPPAPPAEKAVTPPPQKQKPATKPQTSPTDTAPATQPSEGNVGKISSGSGGTGTRHPFTAVKTDEIPVFLPASVYADQNAETKGAGLESGHIATDLPANDKIKIGTVQKFEVPQGMAMFQVSCEPNRARSLLGQAMSFAKGKTAQYSILDDAGNRYWALGEVRIARQAKGGKVEVQYRANPEAADNMPERALQPPRSVDEQELLTPQSVVTYLFVVPANAKITRFSTQGRDYEITF